MLFFKTLLDNPLPAQLESATEDMDDIAERDKSVHWKIKGISAKITYRIFSKYASTRYLNEGTPEMEFNNKFQVNFGEMLLESHMQMLFKKKTGFVGSKTLNFVIKFMSASCKIERTMNKLKPFIENILYECVIPIMLVSHRDISLFQEDPVEYIRKCEDLIETIYMPKNTCLDLLQYVCQYKSKKKGKPDFLIPFLTYSTNNMVEYQQMIASGANPDWRIKEALLSALGYLSDEIENFKDV
jgi:hypothetical protein